MPHIVSLQTREFKRLSQFITAQYGIKMPEVKRTLLESRLQKRLRHLNISSFKDYCEYLFSDTGMNSELPHFIDKITTNKTEFFRESDHFESLVQIVLPSLLSQKKSSDFLRIWSAGCSTGEEPYTLAMVIDDYLRKTKRNGVKFSILATDISSEVLTVGKRAVYHESKAIPVPLEMKRKYLLKSRNHESQLVKIVPEVRSLVKFSQLNFMSANYGIREKMDVIFCRNVIIYFDKQTQELILSRIVQHLNPGGYFFQGHSETIQGIRLPVQQVLPTIYQKHNEPGR